MIIGSTFCQQPFSWLITRHTAASFSRFIVIIVHTRRLLPTKVQLCLVEGGLVFIWWNHNPTIQRFHIIFKTFPTIFRHFMWTDGEYISELCTFRVNEVIRADDVVLRIWNCFWWGSLLKVNLMPFIYFLNRYKYVYCFMTQKGGRPHLLEIQGWYSYTLFYKYLDFSYHAKPLVAGRWMIHCNLIVLLYWIDNVVSRHFRQSFPQNTA